MKRFLAGILGLLLLVGTNGVTMAQHWCGGKVHSSKVQLIPESLSCGMPVENVPCEDKTALKRTPCCQDVFHQYQVEDSFQANSQQIPTAQLIAIPAPVRLLKATLYQSEAITPLDADPPPLVIRDIPVFIQSFLI